MLLLATNSYGQDLFMRRMNSVGNWRLYVNNNGILFNQSDAQHIMHDGVGGFWYEPSGRLDSMIFGAGLWLGGFRHRGDSLAPHVEYSYEPNHGVGGFAPGSVVYDGDAVDTSDKGRDNYRIYRSTDLAGPAWPVRQIGDRAAYVNDPLARIAAGPAATIGHEDVFAVYKDTDPRFAYDSIGDPFRLEIRTQVATWRSGLLKDVALVHNEIIYSGRDTVFEPVVAVVVDGDIFFEGDDRLKRVARNEGALAAVFYTDQSTTEPMMGVTTFGQGGPRRTTTGITVMRYWDIYSDPTTDSQRYDFLTDQRHELELSRKGDARLLLASKSSEPWYPGDTITFDFVLFAQPASGIPELSTIDSSNMLRIAELLTSHYFTGTLPQLKVRPEPAQPDFRRVGNTLFVQDASARLLDVLGRNVGQPEPAQSGLVFDLTPLVPGCYFLSSESGLVKISR